MSCAMSSSLYGGLHLYRSPGAEEEPSAAELLEATKRLYVKTDVLKETRIDACTPRLFHSPADEAPRRPRVVAVAPSGSGFRPSANSAFRPIIKEFPVAAAAAQDDVVAEDSDAPPARPPKSTRIIQRARRLHQESICPISGQHRGSPPPLPPMRSAELPDRLSVGYELSRRKSAPATEAARPVPAPRLSKLSSASTNSQPTPPPQPLPRRRTIQIDGSLIRVDNMSKSSPDLISPRLLSPNSSRHSPCLPSTVIRKRMAPSLVRPPTPLPAHESVTVAPTQRPTPSPHGHSSHGGVHGRRHQTMLSLPSGSMPLSSPTSTGKATSKDSGVQPSDEEEDYRKHSSSLSEEVAVVVEDDDDSIFTSITNQPRREEPAPAEEPSALSAVLSRPLSVIEKHTRIITWIKSSATVPPEEEPHHHHTTHHHHHHHTHNHNELTV